MKANLQKRIDEIASDLSKGLSRKDLINKYGEKYGVKQDCVDKYIRKAKDRAIEIQKKENEYFLEIRRKSSVLVAHVYISQANKRLLGIIKGKCNIEEKCYDKESGKIIVYDRKPNAIEVIEAIKEYNRLNSIYDRS